MPTPPNLEFFPKTPMRTRSLWTSAWLCVASLLAGASSGRAQCLDWKAGFGLPGPSGAVEALTVFDDGTGPALYAGGSFTNVEGVPAHYIAKWDGSTWSALGSGVAGPSPSVNALTVFDDGTGPALYVGGHFKNAGGVPANDIAKWNGSNWSALGSGMDNDVLALSVFDDGTGPALCAAGSFTTAGGMSAGHIAKWNGSKWSALGSGTDARVHALAVFDDGSGPALHAGGDFTTAGGASADGIAKWNGSVWSALGSGTDGGVLALTVFDDGSGPALCAGGGFTTAGGVSTSSIAKWNGSTWSALGSGVYGGVLALTVHDDGSGPALYVGGAFQAAGTVSANRIARWSGSSWSALASPRSGDWSPFAINALAFFDSGAGPALHAGASVLQFPGTPSVCLARWDGSNWAPVGSADGMTGSVSALAVFDDGTGPALYAGGDFHTAGGTSASGIAEWDGSSWSALGSGVDGPHPSVNALTVFDDGTGPALYIGGQFKTAGGVPANSIARWNGSTWSALRRGVNGEVQALAVFDDGTGPALYVGGNFKTGWGATASNIAKWNGSTWSALRGGVNGEVHALTVFNDGSGPALYAGGNFTTAGRTSTNRIAKWDGSSWSALASGVSGPYASVNALTVFDGGTGPALYAGGCFTTAGGASAGHIAKWNGLTWSALGSGFASWSYIGVSALAVFDDGSGAELYAGAGGLFEGAASDLYKWNGSTWSSVGSVYGEGSSISALIVFEGASDPAPDLYVGGMFQSAGATPSGGIAQWLGCGQPGAEFCFGDGSAGSCPCGNSGARGHGCENSASTGGALLDSSGWTSLAFDSLKLTSSGERSSALSIFLQGSAEIAPSVFGAGLRCTGGKLNHLYARTASGGVVSAPLAGDPKVSARSAALGDPLSVGATRLYQVYYRDPSPTFCPDPPGNTWNVSSGLRIRWLP